MDESGRLAEGQGAPGERDDRVGEGAQSVSSSSSFLTLTSHRQSLKARTGPGGRTCWDTELLGPSAEALLDATSEEERVRRRRFVWADDGRPVRT